MLFALEIVNYSGWNDGYHSIIGNIPLDQMNNTYDYGLWSTIRRKYLNIFGDELAHKSQYRALYGLGSYGYIGRTIHRVLNGLELFEILCSSLATPKQRSGSNLKLFK
ncbi:hypothetical protein [Paenibacillus glacialis]|uniref:Uncharacterized protein n=1 Tax=Paenibacillus glacialis TaxID=494026 RepID=A0A168KKQ5_9BACL|nr:hypothetical protein [Paenibacillus glacialis]OAB42150.1 hypothetical protein PGLA_13890 [Paenibacillus glacialis]